MGLKPIGIDFFKTAQETMLILTDFAELQKYSRQICGRQRFHRHQVNGIKANEVPFENLPVETRIRLLKQELGPRTISQTTYYVAFMGEWLSISKAEYDEYQACGLKVKQETITKEIL